MCSIIKSIKNYFNIKESTKELIIKDKINVPVQDLKTSIYYVNSDYLYYKDLNNLYFITKTENSIIFKFEKELEIGQIICIHARLKEWSE